MNEADASAPLRAAVDEVLLAHAIRPDESLGVHLNGTVGADGSWALDSVHVALRPDGAVVVEPRVRRVAGDNFIQMVIPLDVTVRVPLRPGMQRVIVQGKDQAIESEVRVAADARRAAPSLRLEGAAPVAVGADAVVNVSVTATVADGFVERIEVREVAGGTASAWRAPDFVERAASATRQGTVSIRRPAGDTARRVEARAVDGQNAVSETAVIELPSR